MDLSEEERQTYVYLKKGYEGEIMFDTLTEELECGCYILNDLLFKVNNTFFQIDTLIIFQNTINFFEVKNFEGDFIYEAEKLYTKAKKVIKNPLLQLKRSDSLLYQLLQNYGFHFPVEAWVVFINPEFTLYQAPINEPIIFPTQLPRFMKKLNMIPSKLNGKHEKLANLLVSLHIDKSPFTRLPPYKFDQQKKGITCALCDSFSITVMGNKCVCGQCGHGEDVESAVLRSIAVIKQLFPDMKITTNIVFEWCQVVKSKKRVSRILAKNFKIVGVHKGAFYE
jgi:hypothetical protein